MEGRKGKWSPEAGGAEAVKIYLARPCYINIGDFSDQDKSCAGALSVLKALAFFNNLFPTIKAPHF